MNALRFVGEMFSPSQLKTDFTGWSVPSMLWLFVAVAAIVGISVHWGESFIGILSAVTGVICVVLVAKGKVSNYSFGLVNVILYGYVAYNATYYGDAMLNWLFYLPLQFIGFYYWTQKYTSTTETVIVRSLTLKQYLIGSAAIALAIVLFSFGLEALGDRMPLHDATTTVLSITAMFLMIARYREQWVCWIIVNIISVYMWISYTMLGEDTGIAALMMWMVFLINSVYGWFVWTRLESKHVAENLEDDDNNVTEHL